MPTQEAVFNALRDYHGFWKNEEYHPRKFNFFPGPKADEMTAEEMARMIFNAVNDPNAKDIDLNF